MLRARWVIDRMGQCIDGDGHRRDGHGLGGGSGMVVDAIERGEG